MKNIIFLILNLWYTPLLYSSDVTGNVINASMPDCPDGAINLMLNGGYPPYQFVWTGPNHFAATTEDITGLVPGMYHVMVEDALCGKVWLDFEVSVNPNTAFITWKKNTSYCGPLGDDNICDGAINLEVNGNGFSYQWGGPNGFNASTQDISNLCQGNYQVTVTQSSGCSMILNEKICCCGSEYDPTSGGGWIIPPEHRCNGALYANDIILEGFINPITTPTSADGGISLRVSGGNGQYFYKWSGPGGFFARTKDISNLALSGNYCVTVTDGCSQSSTCFMLNICSESSLRLTGKVTNTCESVNLGMVLANVTGGNSPYTYKWSNGATNSSISNLAAGNYCVTIKDAANCKKEDCFSVGYNTTTSINTSNPCAKTFYCNGQPISQVTYPVIDCRMDDPLDCRLERCYCSLTGQVSTVRKVFDFDTYTFDRNCRLFGVCPNGTLQLVEVGYRSVTRRALITTSGSIGCFDIERCIFRGGSGLIRTVSAPTTTRLVANDGSCDGPASCIQQTLCGNTIIAATCIPNCYPTPPNINEGRIADSTHTTTWGVVAQQYVDSSLILIPIDANLSDTISTNYSPNDKFHHLVSWQEVSNLPETPHRRSDVSHKDIKKNGLNNSFIWPNPFNQTLNVWVDLMNDTSVKIILRNTLGTEVLVRFFNGNKGPNQFEIDDISLPVGIYFLDITANQRTIHQMRIIHTEK